MLTIATPALASGAGSNGVSGMQGAGAGQSKLAAVFEFAMDTGGIGEFVYTADPNGPNSGFTALCTGYARVYHWKSWDGFPSLRFQSASCVDQDGRAVYLRGKIIDRGTPGVQAGDYAHILWGYTNPVNLHNYFISDNGKITVGEIQILHI
jgi:hypothetical protein